MTKNFSFLSLANPFNGLSFSDIATYFRTVQSPRACHRADRRYRDFSDSEDDCNLKSRIGPVLDGLKEYMSGLRLDDFPSASQT